MVPMLLTPALAPEVQTDPGPLKLQPENAGDPVDETLDFGAVVRAVQKRLDRPQVTLGPSFDTESLEHPLPARQPPDSEVLINSVPLLLAIEPVHREAAKPMAPPGIFATSVEVPVGHADWGDKLVGKLSFLTVRNQSVAEIQLTPPDMGPMEVKVRVQNEQANITVHTANPVVRDQLELHAFRLRDMLEEQGLGLASFDVTDSPRQQANQQGAEEQGDDGQGDDGQGNEEQGNEDGKEPGARPNGEATSLAAGDHTNGFAGADNTGLTWPTQVDIFA